MSDEARVKRWRPKTRTGCRTCRLRRVKCDEGRPRCKKCVSAGRTCDGYEVAAPVASGDRSMILPRSLLFLDSPDYVPPSLNMLPVQLTSPELRAFDCFRTKTVHLLSIHFSGSVWKDVVLRRSHQDPTILHGIIAIGAMFQIRYQTAGQLKTLAQVPGSPNENKEIALRHYTKALTELRTLIASSRSRDRSNITHLTMIACLLFVTFEMLNGDQMQAMSHMMKGLEILDENSAQSRSPRINGTKETKKDRISPTLEKITDIFARLDAECALSGPWAPFLQRSYDSLEPTAGPSIQDDFKSIAEAKACLDALTSEVLVYRNTLLKMVEQDYDTPPAAAPNCLRNFCILNTKARRVSLEGLSGMSSRRDELLKAYDHWLAAIDPLRVGLSRPTAALMEVQSFYSRFVLSTLQDRSELLCDQYMDRFEHILDLISMYHIGVNRKAGSFGFALDSGILVSLYLLGIKCRDSATRKRVISMLKQARVQEGLWSGGILAAVVEKVVVLEESMARNFASPESVEDDLKLEQIPEDARFSDVAFIVVDSGVGRVVCTRFVNDVDDDIDVREESFTAAG